MPTDIQQLKAKHREIVDSLISTLPKAASTGGTKDWTLAVKQTMHDLCNVHVGPCKEHYAGTYICNDCAPGHKEWLLDVLWWAQTKSSLGVLLGLEAERADNVGEVCSDFERVLAVKTPIKIVLFGAGKGNKHSEREHIEALNKFCKRWCQHSRGDIFYAINFHDGRHDTFFYEAEKDGAIPEFTFRKVEKLSGHDNLASA